MIMIITIARYFDWYRIEYEGIQFKGRYKLNTMWEPGQAETEYSSFLRGILRGL